MPIRRTTLWLARLGAATLLLAVTALLIALGTWGVTHRDIRSA